MLAATSKAVFHGLAGMGWLQRLASRYGMAPGYGFARRFIAGETVDEAIVAAREVAANGFGVSLDYLGESVATVEAADAVTKDYLDIVARVVASGVERNLSLKLTQLGLDVDTRHGDEEPAAHPRSRQGPSVLRAHRHGELAVHRPDARHGRHALVAGLHERRHGDSVMPAAQRG